ncbi:hypothetical protein Tco_0720029, partial [Tanacetum coccineum]
DQYAISNGSGYAVLICWDEYAVLDRELDTSYPVEVDTPHSIVDQNIQRDPLFDEIPEDTVDHMETENAQDMGRTKEMVDEDKEIDENILSTEDVLSTDKEVVSTDKEKVSTDRPIVSTDGSKVSTDRQIEGTDEQNEGTEEQIESTDGQRKGTEDHTEEGSATQATQTPTSTIFGDDETIAKVLLNMSQAKAVSREKEKGVELKDIEETDRPRPTSTRSLLTLKPLPKIDPKDKGKKKIEEEDESESESDGIPEAEKKFKQLESDEEMARKIQEEWEGEEERNRIAEEKATNEALIRNFDDIKARIEADRLLAEKLQEQEREQFTIEERAKFLHDTIAAQRKFLAQQRSEAIRNRPPTKNQLRNQMMTYLKHVGNFKHAELKIKKFEEVQALYEKIKRSDEDFISIGSAEDERLIKRMNEKGVDSSKSEVIKEENKEEAKEENKEEESTRKRKLGTRKKMKSRKRRYIQNTSEDDSEKENDELRLHLTIAPDEEKEVDYEILDRKRSIQQGTHTCALGKSTKKPHKPKSEDTNQEKLYMLHMDLYGPMCVASVNGKRITISQSPKGIFINQSKYALESLKKYSFDSCDPVDTPMVEKSKLDEDYKREEPFADAIMHSVVQDTTLRSTFVVCDFLEKVEAILKSASTEKDQIDNFLKERRLMKSLEKVDPQGFEGLPPITKHGRYDKSHIRPPSYCTEYLNAELQDGGEGTH